ncbi:uncharacterized protein LOC128389572 [Panonychus citri]|uniref:uncharacterized protein LOC128389572 n=1 Tax=Panonychus citri TaxID=50023 RepID=UPI0023081329|nr:uncharacterized protein LOC128389572 [Panonychus citri]
MVEDFDSSDLEIDELPDFNRQYLNSLVEVISSKAGNNSDYHKYHHYMLDKFTETWADEEKNDYQKEIGFKEFACPRTCKFCGCVRRKLKIRTKKVKRVKRKYYFLICRFCKKSILINKLGSNLAKVLEKQQQNEAIINSGATVMPRKRSKPKPKPKPVVEDKPEVVPVIKTKKIENFNHEDTLKQLNFLLKGGNGGKKLNINELQRSRLMDLLM